MKLPASDIEKATELDRNGEIDSIDSFLDGCAHKESQLLARIEGLREALAYIRDCLDGVWKHNPEFEGHSSPECHCGAHPWLEEYYRKAESSLAADEEGK